MLFHMRKTNHIQRLLSFVFFLLCVQTPAQAQASDVIQRKWVDAPIVIGHLADKELGVVINTNDPYSKEVGAYYIKARKLADWQVLRVQLPVVPGIGQQELAALKTKIDEYFGDRVQALALVWQRPFAVDCNSITGAITMGFDPAVACDQQKSCQPTRQSPYFGSTSTAPFKDFGMRLTMLLAASDESQAKALIDRGVKADGSLTGKNAPTANVHFVEASDVPRNVRKYFYPPAGLMPAVKARVYLDKAESLKNRSDVLLYQIGAVTVGNLDTIKFLPGALADHLTSYGGALQPGHGQMTAFSWIDAGVTATYGTTSEPCAHWQKFPHPQALLQFYAQGATAIESYWKSVMWPQQGLFVGEPLASPFSPKRP
jgi:uncharacterized protein (TIGR03790 family)